MLFTVTAAGTINFFVNCFVEGTKITLADGSYKNVEDITYDDNILVWNLYEGKLDSAKPYWIEQEMTAYRYAKLNFSDGSCLKLVGPNEKVHRLFSIEKQQFLYANEIVGDHVYCQDGTIKQLVSIDRIEEQVKFYNFKTEKYLNCFADGVLTGHTFNNLYEIKDMEYINLDQPKYTQEQITELEAAHNINAKEGYEGNFKVTI